MPSLLHIALLVYPVLAPFAFRIGFRESFKSLRWTDMFGCSMGSKGPRRRFWMALRAGCFGVLFAPLVVGFACAARIVGVVDRRLAAWDYERVAAVIGGESREQKQARRLRERKRLQARIDTLERECEIGPYAHA